MSNVPLLVGVSGQRAIATGFVHDRRGCAVNEEALRWPKIRALASRCKDTSGVLGVLEREIEALAVQCAHGFDKSLFWDLCADSVFEFLSCRIHPPEIAFLCSLARFPQGIHAVFGGVENLGKHGYESHLSIPGRFYNPTGWTVFTDFSSHVGDSDTRLMTFAGRTIPSQKVIFDGLKGCKLDDQRDFAHLVLMALLHDRVLEKKLYRDTLGIFFD